MHCVIPLPAAWSILVVASAVPGYAQSATSSDTAELRTAATVSRMVRPNRAVFTVQFFAEGSTPRQAGARVATRADSIRRAFMALGVPRDSLLTGSSWYWWSDRLQVLTQPRMTAVPNSRINVVQQAQDTIVRANGAVEIRGIMDTTYRSREIIELRISDLSRIGALIDTALSFGIRDISGIRFAATEVREAQLSAMREATTRAREQAEAMATASGGRLGRILSLGTQPDYSERYSSIEGVVVNGSMGGGGTEITAPSVAVTMTVYARWQLLER